LPFVTTDKARLYYRVEGNDDRPVVIFSHSLGTDNGMWDLQVADLLPYFRILRYDTRGHGGSSVPDGEYTIEHLACDVLAIADALQIDKFAFCGSSLGGMTGQWLAANAPGRITHLVLANTSPRMSPPSAMETRRLAVLDGGTAAVVDAVMQRFFSKETWDRMDPRAASVRSTFLSTDRFGYAGCCAAIRDMDHTHLLGKIQAPTLVIVGDQDVSTPWEGHGEVLSREIKNARVLRLRAAHLSNLERPRSFNAALLDFLLPPAVGDPLQAGFEIRRAVLGGAHVDAAIAATTDLNREFQELITRYAWGTIWTRPALDPRTRRLLVLAMTAALGRWEEFRLHVRTGNKHELELRDLKEVLLQVAIYAGVPAANTGFHIAQEILEEKLEKPEEPDKNGK
jgi:3-oxoadipate enol-lactonase/4-carboxymuconolactone decarboxylase